MWKFICIFWRTLVLVSIGQRADRSARFRVCVCVCVCVLCVWMGVWMCVFVCVLYVCFVREFGVCVLYVFCTCVCVCFVCVFVWFVCVCVCLCVLCVCYVCVCVWFVCGLCVFCMCVCMCVFSDWFALAKDHDTTLNTHCLWCAYYLFLSAYILLRYSHFPPHCVPVMSVAE